MRTNRNELQRKTLNARSETVHEIPMYRDAFKHRSCLLPAGDCFEKRYRFGMTADVDTSATLAVVRTERQN